MWDEIVDLYDHYLLRGALPLQCIVRDEDWDDETFHRMSALHFVHGHRWWMIRHIRKSLGGTNYRVRELINQIQSTCYGQESTSQRSFVRESGS